jgi:hypothetical protein
VTGNEFEGAQFSHGWGSSQKERNRNLHLDFSKESKNVTPFAAFVRGQKNSRRIFSNLEWYGVYVFYDKLQA